MKNGHVPRFTNIRADHVLSLSKGFAHIIVIISLLSVGAMVVFMLYANKINQVLVTQATPTPESVIDEENTGDWNTYIGNGFAFKYPSSFVYLPYENGVIAFFDSQKKLDDCKKFQENQVQELSGACYQSSFTFNSFYNLSIEEYEKELLERTDPEVFVSEVFTDSQGQNWKTYESLGGVYNFDAFTEVQGKYSSLHFQTKSSNRIFLNQILSTFEFID